MNFFIFLKKLDICSRDWKADFALKYCLFGAIKLTKIAGPDKYSNSGCDVGFHSRLIFLTSIFDFGKNVIIYGVDNSSSARTDNKKIIF